VEKAKLLTIDVNGNNAASADFDPDNIDIYGVNIGKWWATWIPFVKSAGGDYLNDDGTAIGMDSPEAIDAMQKLADLIWVHNVSPTPTSSQALPGLSEAIATNKVAMSIDGQWANQALMSDGVNYNVAALPKIGSEAKTIITCGAMTIANGDHQAEAWEFMKYFLSPGALAPLEQSGLWLPTTNDRYTEEYLKSMITDKHPSNYYDAICLPMLDGTADAPLTNWVINFNRINDIISPAMDPVWAGESTYEDAIKSVSDLANEQVAGRRDK
jgi:multiple sugar transport system substrate-binding protein